MDYCSLLDQSVDGLEGLLDLPQVHSTPYAAATAVLTRGAATPASPAAAGAAAAADDDDAAAAPTDAAAAAQVRSPPRAQVLTEQVDLALITRLYERLTDPTPRRPADPDGLRSPDGALKRRRYISPSPPRDSLIEHTWGNTSPLKGEAGSAIGDARDAATRLQRIDQSDAAVDEAVAEMKARYAGGGGMEEAAAAAAAFPVSDVRRLDFDAQTTRLALCHDELAAAKAVALRERRESEALRAAASAREAALQAAAADAAAARAAAAEDAARAAADAAAARAESARLRTDLEATARIVRRHASVSEREAALREAERALAVQAAAHEQRLAAAAQQEAELLALRAEAAALRAAAAAGGAAEDARRDAEAALAAEQRRCAHLRAAARGGAYQRLALEEALAREGAHALLAASLADLRAAEAGGRAAAAATLLEAAAGEAAALRARLAAAEAAGAAAKRGHAEAERVLEAELERVRRSMGVAAGMVEGETAAMRAEARDLRTRLEAAQLALLDKEGELTHARRAVFQIQQLASPSAPMSQTRPPQQHQAPPTPAAAAAAAAAPPPAVFASPVRGRVAAPGAAAVVVLGGGGCGAGSPAAVLRSPGRLATPDRFAGVAADVGHTPGAASVVQRLRSVTPPSRNRVV